MALTFGYVGRSGRLVANLLLDVPDKMVFLS